MPLLPSRLLIFLLSALLCGAPELVAACGQSQSAGASQVTLTSATAQSTGRNSAGEVAPSPVPANDSAPLAAQSATQPLPDAPSAQEQTNTQEQPSRPQSPTPSTEPAGTAAARVGILKGGPASKPAGAAIAPNKQSRVRSLLIKVGAIGAAGAALGTVFALSKASPARPPGAH